MKLLAAALLFNASLAFGQISDQQTTTADTNRFVISENGQHGFIDSSGKIVISQRFENVIEFSEGLCAVRINGRYGFIDTKGTVRIPPTYDYATIFSEGLALVFIDGKPLFIDKQGKVAFASNYKTMSHFVEGRSQVQTYSEKRGIIDQKGILLIDTAYKFIGPFKDGLAIVYGIDHNEYEGDNKKKNLQVSVIDRAGNKLIPYGRFESITEYSEGYFKAQLPKKKGGNVSVDAIINSKGEIVFSLPDKPLTWLEGGVHNGIVRVSLPADKKENDFYDAYMTVSGKKIFDDKNMNTARTSMKILLSYPMGISTIH
jgi:hypothetical protein